MLTMVTYEYLANNSRQ